MENSLNKYLKKQSFLEITLNNNKCYCGYIIKVSDMFIILQIIEDFHFDGFVIIPTKSIIRISNNKHEIFRGETFIKMGLDKNIKNDFNFNIFDYNKIFQQFKNKIIIIETIYKRNNWLFGKIIKYEDNTIYFQEIDSFGKNSKIVKIKEDKISNISFDNEYINMFEKYCIN